MTDHPAFALLKKKFVTRLAVRLEDLDVKLESVAKEPEDTTVLDEVMRGFHSLAGIGGTYGFPAISDRARRAEHVCTSVLRERRAIASVELEQLRRDLGFLTEMRLRAAA